MFPSAAVRTAKAADNPHALLKLGGPIPSLVHVSETKLHDVNVFNRLVLKPAAMHVVDRVYLDFERRNTPNSTGGLRLDMASKYRTIGEEEGLGNRREGEIRVTMPGAVTSTTEGPF